MSMLRLVCVAVMGAILLTACDEPAPAVPRATSSTESPPPRATAKGWPVPDVVGTMQQAAIRALRQQGFAPEVVRRPACPAGVVVHQSLTGRAQQGSTVTLVVLGGDTASCIVPPAKTPARQLVTWAQGEGDAPEFADSVDLLLGNGSVQSVTDPLDRESWQVCEGYAESGCLSPLAIVEGRRFAVRAVPPGATSCPDRTGPLRRGLVERIASSATLVATRNRACLDRIALQVWVDDEGRIDTVNLLLGSP